MRPDRQQATQEATLYDTHIWEWEEDGKTVYSSYRENIKRVRAYIKAMLDMWKDEPIRINLPDKLTPNESKVCKAIFVSRYIKLTTGLVRYSNGRAMDSKAIAELAGINNQRTAQRAIAGLINKEVLIRDGKSRFKINRSRLIP